MNLYYLSAWVNLENKIKWNKKQIEERYGQCNNIFIDYKIDVK